MTDKNRGGSSGDTVKSNCIYLEKRLILRTQVVLWQAATCLNRTKLRWDAEDGWREIRVFYADRRGQHLRDVINELCLNGASYIDAKDREALREQIIQDLRFKDLFTAVQSFLARFRHRFRFQQRELNYVVSSLMDSRDLIADPKPPTAESAKKLEGELGSASNFAQARGSFMQEMAKSPRVERIFPPPAGPIYTYEEIVAALD